MGKIARELAAAPDENMARPDAARPKFDSKVWIVRDDGGYLNTQTGEVRGGDEFARPGEGDAETEDSDIFHADEADVETVKDTSAPEIVRAASDGDWDVCQDAPAQAASTPTSDRAPNPLKTFRVSKGKPSVEPTKQRKGKAA